MTPLSGSERLYVMSNGYLLNVNFVIVLERTSLLITLRLTY